MRLPRITIRRLMILVAVLASPMWYAERHARYTRRAEDHESRTARFLAGSLLRGMAGADKLGRGTTDWESAMHGELAAKYRRAALYPWLRIEPDPDPAGYARSYRDRIYREYFHREPPPREAPIIGIDPPEPQ